MPRKKSEINRNAFIGADGTDTAAASSSANVVPGVFDLPAIGDRAQLASFALDALLLRNDGWIRLIPAGEGKLSYYKYKYTTGPHKGKYVMYVAPYNSWAEGVLGLYEKVGEVDLGTRKPALDTFYDPR